MQRKDRLEKKRVQFQKTLKSFEEALQINSSTLDKKLVDVIENGQIQKFEFCVELFWKLVRYFLLTKEDTLVILGAKSTIKYLLQMKWVSVTEYEQLSQMIDDRNLSSHIYEEHVFRKIHEKLSDYLLLMKTLLKRLENKEFSL